MHPRRVALVATALVVALGPTALGCQSSDEGSGPPDAPGPVEVTPAPVALSDAEVVARAGAAVWRVATEGCDWRGSGSAFAIDDRHLVTNRHVIANDVSPDLVSPTGERRSGRVIGAALEGDVAVIEVDEPLPVTLQWAPTTSLQPAERIVVLGYPAPNLEFTASVGSIVNFQGRDGAREAMLSDVPISPGNSGGPGLRADATVAGVVTQMTLDDPAERAAILFTAESVEAVVERFIAEPDEVLSDCGQGPDYVPPLPEHFDVPAPPPPPPTTATTAPLPIPTVPPATTTTARPTTTRPAATTTTPVPVPCPTGTVSGTVTSFDTEPGPEPDEWIVRVEGTVTNETTAAVTLTFLFVAVATDDPLLYTPEPADVELAPGGSTTWLLDTTVRQGAAPPAADFQRADWVWADPVIANCPTG